MDFANTDSDEILLNLISKGDEAAFTELFRRYREAVRTTAFYILKSNELAEDAMQEIFLNLWKNREKAAATKNINAWLFIATRNNSFNTLRRVRLQRDYIDYLSESVISFDALTNADLLELKDLSGNIKQAIASLPPQRQLAFRMSREQGLSHAEIAERLNISHRTVNDHILKALQHIRQFLHQRVALALAILLDLF